MTSKNIPFTKEKIEEIIKQYPTPIYIYDEKAIKENVRKLIKAFSWAPNFKEYFAVKATPNPSILKTLKAEGVGADCSSIAELILAEKAGLKGQEIFFSSNDTHYLEFQKALELGAVINLDDITHIDYLEKNAKIPETISLRYNPGPLRSGGNKIIGKPEEAKYGLTHKQLFEAYKILKDKGVKHFGLHTMIVSNELDPDYLIQTAEMIFDLVVEIYNTLNIKIEFINLGGGVGIPYYPDNKAIDYDYWSKGVKEVYEQKIKANSLDPLNIFLECGRVITGPYGYLISTVLHKKDTYKNYIGLDACMANLMRPGMYGAYHHITVLGKEKAPAKYKYDVTGSLCENNDKFAIDRMLPKIDIGDIVVIHDTGAHGHAMGFNYNGKLRSAELLLKEDCSIKLIRRAETLEDYFASLDFKNL